MRPASRPSAWTGTTSSPCSATRPCAGRTKRTLVQPSASWYCMTLGIGSCAIALVERALQALGQGRAGGDGVEEQRLGLAVGRRCRLGDRRRVGADGGELLQQRRRRLAVARRGRRSTGISFSETARSAARAATPSISTASRRGVANEVTPRHRRSQALGAQAGDDASANAAPSVLQRLRRQLLDEQLDQQRRLAGARHHAACRARRPCRAASCATTSSAHGLGAIGKPSRARLSR